MHHKQEPKVQFVVDAVYAFAFALHNAWLDKCNGEGKICNALRDLDGGEFYNKYLLNVSFRGEYCLSSKLFMMLEQGAANFQPQSGSSAAD